jgi:four helix bundle protein
MTNEEFAEFFKNKTKNWAIKTINYLNTIPDSPVMRNIRFQLIKSCTSVAANYRAACRGRSNAEFYSKISISLEEADESLFWFEMIEGCEIDKSIILKELQEESRAIIGVLVKARMNTSK